MLAPGDPIPDASLFTAPRASVSLRELAEERPALFVFYLLDFSAT